MEWSEFQGAALLQMTNPRNLSSVRGDTLAATDGALYSYRDSGEDIKWVSLYIHALESDSSVARLSSRSVYWERFRPQSVLAFMAERDRLRLASDLTTPEWPLELLAADPSSRVRGAAGSNPRCPAHVRRALMHDTDHGWGPVAPGASASVDAGIEFYLGMEYWVSDDIPGRVDQAIAHMSRAADLGHPRAMVQLRHIFEEEGRTEAAFSWFKAAAGRGNVDAAVQLGNLYLSADPLSGEAITAFSQAANAGNADGMMGIAIANINRRAPNIARNWLEKAAEAGHPEARGLLAQFPQSTSKPGACYIATAVYGSYEAPEVVVLRRFRDEQLMATLMGRLLVRAYYAVSPPVAARLRNAGAVNRWVRRVLDRIVSRIPRR